MSHLRRRLAAAVALAAIAAGWSAAGVGASTPATWQAWQHLPGVFDLAGPRADGTVVAAAAGRLYQIAPDGRISPFADGPQGYRGSDGPEAYIALSPGLQVSGAGCRFAGGDLFVLDLGGDIGVESAGVVPLSGGVLVADRGTPGSPHPGTDSVLRIEPAALAAAGAAPGDVLLASEGGVVTVDLRCAATCTVRTVAGGPAPAHGEGHLVGLGPAPGVASTRAATAAPGAG